jgi:hypothetical protein
MPIAKKYAISFSCQKKIVCIHAFINKLADKLNHVKKKSQNLWNSIMNLFFMYANYFLCIAKSDTQ